MIEVEIKGGGEKFQFPEGTDPEVMKGAIQQYLGQKPKPEEAGIMETIGTMGAQGLTAGFFEDIAARAGAGVLKALPAGVEKIIGTEGKGYGELVDAGLKGQRGRMKEIRKQRPGLSAASEIGGALLAPIKAASGTGSLVARMAKGSAVGGAQSALYGFGEIEPESESIKGAIGERVIGAGKAAGVGAGVSAVLPVLGVVIRKTPDAIKGLLPEEEIANAVGRVKKAYKNADDAVNRLYGVAKVKGKDVAVSRVGVGIPIARKMLNGLREEAIDITGEGMSTPARYMNEFIGFMKKDRINVNRLEQWRRGLTKNADRATDPTVRAALRTMRNSYDEVVESVVDAAAKRGDDTALGAWRRAVSARRDMGRIFQTNKRTGQSPIFEKIVKGEDLTNDQIVNMITGVTTSKKDTGQIVKRMLTAAGEGSEQVRMNLRNGMLLKAIERSGGRHGVFKKELQDLLRKNPDMAKTVFTESERKVIQKIAGKGEIPRAVLPTAPNDALTIIGTYANAASRTRTAAEANKLLEQIADPLAAKLRGTPTYYGNMIVAAGHDANED